MLRACWQLARLRTTKGVGSDILRCVRPEGLRHRPSQCLYAARQWQSTAAAAVENEAIEPPTEQEPDEAEASDSRRGDLQSISHILDKDRAAFGEQDKKHDRPGTTTDKPIGTVVENDASLANWTDYADRLDPMILETMKSTFRYKTMTNVQKILIEQLPIKQDLLVRSRTGTGKTLAFLVPALQNALEHFKAKGLTGTALKTYANRNATILVISPTRELANQIATEARRLVTIPGSNMKALCLVGGEAKRAQLKLMRRERNDFVVATPGRLIDCLENEPEFANLMLGVQTLILDEADTLLDMGFKQDLERIVSLIPRERQTYMFSATVSKDIQRISKQFLKQDHRYVNTVNKDDQDINVKIKQEYITRPATDHMKTVLSLIISEQLKKPTSKVIVFFPTTKMTMLYATAFKTLRRLYPDATFQQFDLHAKRTQEHRAKVSQAFKSANAGSVLFTTDVSARGVDYPGVDLVIQVGAPQSRDLYIHRTGRTGRAGLTGNSVLLLQPFEREFLNVLGKEITVTEKEFPDSEIALGPAQTKVFDLMYKLSPPELVEEAFSSLAGAYLPRARELRQDKHEMLQALEAWWRLWAGSDPAVPRISSNLMSGGPRRDGGRGYGRMDDRRDASRGYGRMDDRRDASRGYGRMDDRRDGHRSPRRFMSPEKDWRPRRNSEWLPDGTKRKDFSKPVQRF